MEQQTAFSAILYIKVLFVLIDTAKI